MNKPAWGMKKEFPRNEERWPIRSPTVSSPFINPTAKTSAYEKFKIVLMCVSLILPLRLLLAVGCLFGMVLFSRLSTVGLSEEDKTKPLSSKRLKIQYGVRFFARATLFVCGFHWIPTKGKPAPKDQAPIMVPNHMTFFEVLYLFAATGGTFMGKDEVETWPVIGAGIKGLQCLFVNRLDPISKAKAKNAVLHRTKSGENWPQLIIYPEGTTTNGQYLVRFKRGPFLPGVPVQPVYVRMPNQHCNLGWVCGIDTGFLFIRTLCQFFNRMEVEYGDVYYPSPAEQKNATLYADNFRAKFAQHEQLPVRDLTFEDLYLVLECYQLELPPETVHNVIVRKVKLQYRVEYNDIVKILKEFKESQHDPKGTVGFDSFLKSRLQKQKRVGVSPIFAPQQIH